MSCSEDHSVTDHTASTEETSTGCGQVNLKHKQQALQLVYFHIIINYLHHKIQLIFHIRGVASPRKLHFEMEQIHNNFF